MKCILLAAGYATRLYPLTKDMPKSLLDVGGITILEHILKKIERVDSIDVIYIVTNQRYYEQFCRWVHSYGSLKKISVINDNTTSNENRLGAIADIQFAIDQEKVNGDILVMAGDNLFDFDLEDFVSFYYSVNKDCITVHECDDVDSLKKTGVVEVNGDGKVLSFEEKPQVPRSNLAVPPFYIYKADTLNLIKEYLNGGNNPDAPGNFIPWLIGKRDVFAYKFSGIRYDIGTLESYKNAQLIFSEVHM